MAETLRDAAKLLYLIFRDVLPRAKCMFDQYHQLALQIPNPELRKQALASMGSKQFHADGGSVYVLLAKDAMDDMSRFIVAFQTISDYLDNLCDRSTSLDPEDFRQLHVAMTDAVNPAVNPAKRHYYRYREDQDDGGYLCRLVEDCQAVLRRFPHYSLVQTTVEQLVVLYSELQTHKHVNIEERENRLIQWWEQHRQLAPAFHWWEFAAATGSTLGVFVLCALASNPALTPKRAEEVVKCYFPWMGAVHILLDYLIDQEEDRKGGDLNFVSYYENWEQTVQRIEWIVDQTRRHVSDLPDASFHQLVVQGLMGLYLSDMKARNLPEARQLRLMYRKYGKVARFFHFGSQMYRFMRK
ncbi:tetraprenyl-beta-curcumene synthase family protein [Fodinisporobacter ferrooxydans]|uniref:Tetraprenyl-beta-curcumene synthase family protein n=1 Tax=Fodinisporobacter ferrooxydans TaxID=2901836 RepID=A0ABY4CJ84_9BACL|nr:tetraprenyl-beta-curcumene synthase family protein [Alicyclobacillaceae bacterium MYW30-H2]